VHYSKAHFIQELGQTNPTNFENPSSLGHYRFHNVSSNSKMQLRCNSIPDALQQVADLFYEVFVSHKERKDPTPKNPSDLPEHLATNRLDLLVTQTP